MKHLQNNIHSTVKKYHNNFRFRRKKCCQLYNYFTICICVQLTWGNTDKWHRCPVMFYFMFFYKICEVIGSKNTHLNEHIVKKYK